MALSVASPTEGTLQIAGAVVIGTLDGSGNFQQYVGPSYKSPCRAATTANVVIATALNAGDSIDGVTLAAGDRVLVKNQSSAAQNGIYVAGVTPARASDMDEWSEVPGAVVGVTEGSANADTAWLCTSNAGGTISSTAINFSSFGASFDQNNVAITGGTINGTPIGGSDPRAVTATTVNATKVLTGTPSGSAAGAVWYVSATFGQAFFNRPSQASDYGEFIFTTGNVVDWIFGTRAPDDDLHFYSGGDKLILSKEGDLTFSAVSKGPVVKSPDGNRWRLEVSNAGVISAVDLDP